MKFVRGDAAARWMPSRYNFALFRLAAVLRLASALRTPRERRPDVVFFVDRHQSVFENYAVSLWFNATASCFLAYGLQPRWGLAPALLASFPLAALLLELPMYLSGLVIAPLWKAAFGDGTEVRQRVNGFVMMTGLFATSCWFALHGGWAAPAAWQVLALFAANGVAAVLLFALRARIAAAERRFGGDSSVA